MTPTLRLSPQTRLVLEALLAAPADWRYGYDLSRETRLKSGTLYPILMRLAEHTVVESCWEPSSEEGRPPRHMYRLTGDGLKWVRDVMPRPRSKGALRPVASEGGAR